MNIEEVMNEKGKICDRVIAGEKIPCPKCGASLIAISPWGNSEWATEEQVKKYPGVYCPTDEKHFAISITYITSEEANEFDLYTIEGFKELKTGNVNIMLKLKNSEEIYINYIKKIDTLYNYELIYLLDKGDKSSEKSIRLEDILSVTKAQ